MKKISELVSASIDRKDIDAAVYAGRILRRWAEVVGADLAKRCAPDNFSKGTVWVAVEGSAWAQELRMHKDDILGRLNEIAGYELFQAIRFGVRPFVPVTLEIQEEVAVVQMEDMREHLTIKEIAERRMRNYPTPPTE